MLHLTVAGILLAIAIGGFFVARRFDGSNSAFIFVIGGVASSLVSLWLARARVAVPFAEALDRWLPERTSMLHTLSIIVILVLCLIMYVAGIVLVAQALERMTRGAGEPREAPLGAGTSVAPAAANALSSPDYQGGVRGLRDQAAVLLAKVTHVYGNAVWIESDILGDRHVMIQSKAPGAASHCFCTFRYDHHYTNNASLDQAAERIALLLGAAVPVERRVRDMPARPPAANSIRVLPAQDQRVENGPIQFGEDWPGVFIRGDSAGYYAMTLRAILQPPAENASATTDAIARIQLGGLYDLLRGCVVGPASALFPRGAE